MIKLILISLLTLIPIANKAQLFPILGFRYTGGLSYDQDHEYFSLETGLTYKIGEYNNPNNFLLSDEITLSYELIYDSTKIFSPNTVSLYNIRIKNYKFFSDIFAITYGVSYINTYKKPNIKPNLGYNLGIAIIDNKITSSLLYERINGFGYGAIEINFKLWNLNY